MSNSPVVVFIAGKNCPHCDSLKKIWPKICARLSAINNNIRFHKVKVTHMKNRTFDVEQSPKGLLPYMEWYPAILLVPGQLWNNAMMQLGPNNQIVIKEGVQIMNGVWNKIKNKPAYTQKYDIREVEDFVKWYNESSSNENFVKANEVSTVLTPPIQPIITVTKKDIVTGDRDYISSNNNNNNNNNNNRCGLLNIISNPYFGRR